MYKSRSYSQLTQIVGYVLIGVGAILGLMYFGSPQTIFAEPPQQETPPPPITNPDPSNQECLACHAQPDMILPLANGEELSLSVDSQIFDNSIHGQAGYACVQCHTDIDGFPHPEMKAESLRQVSLEKTQVCVACHIDQGDLYAKGQHAQALISGNQDTAVCTDCHNSHQTNELSSSHVKVAQTCQNCHSEIYQIYQNSVHGKALLEENNLDVPTCTNCHESHDNTGPGDAGFVLFSPQICANCHADEKLMQPYDINTNVFDTYLADFHGSTVVIFEQIAPDQETNKPVCIDCHGVHNILSPEDENSSVIKQNLIQTCARCHPDATPDFANAWLSHYPPDINHHPIVYLVNQFYAILIPLTVGGLLVFIGSDVWKSSKVRLEDAKLKESNDD